MKKETKKTGPKLRTEIDFIIEKTERLIKIEGMPEGPKKEKAILAQEQ